MKALIIAAGEGSRLKNLTKEEPKALVHLLGISLIERVILTAKQAGINEFLIVVGYLGDRVRDRLGRGERYGVKIGYIENKEWQRGNGVSVLKARKLLKENFILLMSDHIFDVRILKELPKNLETSLVLAVDRRKSLPQDTKVLEKKGKIIRIGKNIRGNCIDTGIFLCSPGIFLYLREAINENKTELADGIAKAAENRDAEIFDITQIDPYIPGMRKEIKPWWMDIDSEEDLTRARDLLIENACKGRNDILATYVNKPIENFIVGRVADTQITPNQVTLITNIIAYMSTFLFLSGYLLLASLLTFIVSFMDGVDGKLSRIKLSYSNIGKLEHAFDFLFEHTWYIALAVYLSGNYGLLPLLLGTLILLFDGFSHYCEDAFEKVVGYPLVDYGKIERAFRKFDGRKNTYIIFILMGILMHIPFWSLVVMFIWSLVSAIFYSSRAIRHIYTMDLR